MKTSPITGVGGSLIFAAVLICHDVLLWGSFLLSAFVVPIWVLVGGVQALIQRKGWSLSLRGMAIPLITLAIVVSNARVQSQIARSHARLIIDACTRYHEATGAYPPTLKALVPVYLRSVPPAKYALFGFFLYSEFQGRHDLMWIDDPPFGRPYYRFEEARWGYLD